MSQEFSRNEYKYLQECIESTYASSIGKFVSRFEADLCLHTGSRYAVAVVNGTGALHIALLLAGVKPKDEVLVPTLSFVATANAVSYCGAIPHFVDIEERTLGIDVLAIRDYLKTTSQKSEMVNASIKITGNHIHSIVPVHVFGHPCDLKVFKEWQGIFLWS